MKKAFIISDQKIENKIEFNILKTEIRKLNKEEKKELIDIFNKKIKEKIFLDTLKLFSKNIDNISDLKEIIDYTEQIYDLEVLVFYLCINILEQKESIEDIVIESEIENVYVIEAEEEYIQINDTKFNAIKTICEFIEFTNWIIKDYEKEISVFIEGSKTSLSEESGYATLTREIDKKRVEFDIEIFRKLAMMLNDEDKNLNYKFLYHIPKIGYFEESMEENIKRNVTILESFFLKENEDKQKNFILKIGSICTLMQYYKKNNLSKKLKAIYEIRSCILHGNEIELNKQLKNKSILFDNDILNIKTELDEILRVCIKAYIEFPEVCNYIREN